MDVRRPQHLTISPSTYPVSTSYKGTGSKINSNKTPLGFHAIAEKIGAGAPLGTVFKNKINTKRTTKIHTKPVNVKEDLILTRVITLKGLEEGRNLGGDVDSFRRAIYIHGTNEEGLIRRPFSIGCIRMRNMDIVDLFNRIEVGTVILIEESSNSYSELEAHDPLDDYRVELKVPVYLGNHFRRYYGRGPVPDKLRIIWKKWIGGGETTVWDKTVKWYGTGWPSQGILVRENDRLFILFGALDRHLWKLDALTGETIWKYKFDNTIKGTCSLWINPEAAFPEEKAIAFCGSRKDLDGNKPLHINRCYRAVSLLSGKELWRQEIPRTDSYSRDVDGNGIIFNGMLYIGAENGILYAINPDPLKATLAKDCFQPVVQYGIKLYEQPDITHHKNNLVVESSPSIFRNTIFVTAGSGRIYGLARETGTKTWEFYTGSDIDSTPVINREGHLLVGIEKEYIEGPGGVFKLNPAKPGSSCVEWYFPVEDSPFASWQGGIIGSVSINDEYNLDDSKPALAAFCSLDGYLYVVSQNNPGPEKTPGPNMKNEYPVPELVYKEKIGPSISTPVFIDNFIIAGGYSGEIHIFEIQYTPASQPGESGAFTSMNGASWKINIEKKVSYNLGGGIESTPVVWDGKIYIGCKNGYFYCLGE